VAVLYNSRGAYRQPLETMEAAAKPLNFELHRSPVGDPKDFDSAFAAMASARVEAIAVNEDPMIVGNAARIAALARERRLVSVAFPELAAAGGLLGFGANITEMHRRAAVFIDKILKGAKPGDLPVEQPTKFELLVNTRAAQAIGRAIPQSVLLRADRLIE
jgi:putative tryptophan/tyrosine transport system substrate-binding protein